jgi:hypothetical protein
MRSISKLLESWSTEITNSADRVRMLIGDAHWLTDGTHKENLVREFIRGRLPAAAQATHGFLISPGDELVCSPEIDVLIRDCQDSCAFFDEGGVAICDARAALAYWQVKSAFAASSLSDALEHVSKVQSVLVLQGHDSQVWRGVCFMQCGDSLTDESILTTVQGQIRKVRAARSERVSGHFATYLPTCVLALPRFALFIDKGGADGGCRLRYFPTGALSFAVGIADMLSHVYSKYSQRRFQPLDQVLEGLLDVKPTILSAES